MSFDFSAFRSGIATKNAQLLEGLDIKLPTAAPAVSPTKKKAPAKPKPPKPKPQPRATDASAQELIDDREKRGLRSSARVRDSLLAPKEKEKLVELASDDEEEGGYSEGGRKVRTEKGYGTLLPSSDFCPRTLTASMPRPRTPSVLPAALFFLSFLSSASTYYETPAPEKVGKRLYNPKRYGAIPGIRPGQHYDFRTEASTASIHAPVVAGIAAGQQGCYSICVSGGYDGDVDLGERLTYSGSGGRDLKGTATNRKNLRTAAQSFDQSWETPLNASLLRSVKSQKPIRVMRGYKGKSCYAPVEGYRYDGLYVAAKAWQDDNDQGLKICRVALVRLPGQGPIPIQPGREKEAGEALPAAALDEGVTGSSSSSAQSEEGSTPATSPEPAEPKRKTAVPKRKRASTVASKGKEAEVDSADAPPKRRRSARFP
ncbi:hypothetical protein JCM11641_007559 [Rhodosporidiobolus odoratus]